MTLVLKWLLTQLTPGLWTGSMNRQQTERLGWSFISSLHHSSRSYNFKISLDNLPNSSCSAPTVLNGLHLYKLWRNLGMKVLANLMQNWVKYFFEDAWKRKSETRSMSDSFKSILRLGDTCMNKILCTMKIPGMSENTRPGIVLSFFLNFDHNYE